MLSCCPFLLVRTPTASVQLSALVSLELFGHWNSDAHLRIPLYHAYYVRIHHQVRFGPGTAVNIVPAANTITRTPYSVSLLENAVPHMCFEHFKLQRGLRTRSLAVLALPCLALHSSSHIGFCKPLPRQTTIPSSRYHEIVEEVSYVNAARP